MKMSPGKKIAIRKMIRAAIKFQNSRSLFSCADCCFCGDTICDLDKKNMTFYALRLASQLPECFMINPLDTAFAGCLELKLAIKVDSFKSINGWGTVVGRLLSHADKYGYIINVKRRNLDKYG